MNVNLILIITCHFMVLAKVLLDFFKLVLANENETSEQKGRCFLMCQDFMVFFDVQPCQNRQSVARFCLLMDYCEGKRALEG